jgi:mRNA-binding protein PUF3
MHRFERFDIVPDMAQRNSISSVAMSTDISAAATPLTSDAQSPQSSSLPSTNTSAVDEPVHNSASKGYSPPHVVGITNAS